MDDLLFKLLYLIILIAVSVIVRYLVPFVKSKTQHVKFTELEDFIAKTIAWAETEVDGDKQGRTKFELVLEMVTDWINEQGVKITTEQSKILIQGIFEEVDGYTVNKDKNILPTAILSATEDVLDAALEKVTGNDI